MGLLQESFRIKQITGNMNTFCIKCRQKITYSETDDEGSYTKKCFCGCEVNKFHLPDKFHESSFYTQLFISKKEYIKDYKKKDKAELLGFKKILNKDGTVNYVK